MTEHFISNQIEEIKIPRLQGKVKDLLNSKQHETKISKSNFNGYGYKNTTYKYILNNDDYNEIKLFIENKNKQKTDRKELTEEEKIEKWSERLSKLTGISLEEAKKIAYEKIEYKENRYIEMIDNYNENPSKKNYQLANKIKNSNPLRYIENKEHAENILIASKRHNNSNYEELIEEGKEMAKYGEIEYSEIKDYARNNYEYFDKEDNMIEDDFMVFEENTSGKILVVQQTNNQYQFNTYLFDKDKEFINFKKISTLFDKTVTEKDNEFSNACDSAMEFYGINKLDVYILELSVILPELKKIISNIEKAKKDGYEAGYNEESFDDFIESMQVNNGTSNVVLEKMYENEMNFNKRPDYLDSEGNPHWYNEDDEDDEDLYFNEDDEDNEDIYFKLADKICQAAESSKEFTLEDLKEKYKEKDKEYSELLHQQFRAENKNEDTSKIKEKISNIRNELKEIENDINKEEIKKEEKLDKNENNFTLKDIGSDKKVKTLKQFENVIRQLATEKNQDTAESKFIDFLGYNLEGGMAGSLYDKIFEKYGDPSYSTLKKQIKKEIETKNKNSNTESTLENYKKQALELCSKDNPTLKLTMFIKDLVKDLSNEEKTLLFTNTINNLTEELKKINANTEQDSQINTQKKGRK